LGEVGSVVMQELQTRARAVIILSDN